MVMVAPLTATLMGSAPVEHAGVASAVNTVISDVGPPLAIAVLFVAVTAHFDAAMTAHVGPAATAAALGPPDRLAPFTSPSPAAPEALRAAARAASTGAFHLAMLVCAVLLLCGAAINAAGIRTRVAPTGPVVSPDPTWRRFCHIKGRKGPTAAPAA
jgi:DHA2 family multidrug resistance protein-like MFS transporter